ncbi:PREDICTED: pectinesterase inhibitor 2-like [Tarenaya hassleriana]|uniref:pectinesterase inhibitor 2-like n=1 Tax=Tarenaya hassleriana TaxID=28532 RepID=UPI00053C79E1|nr:PREDICTED: pectinesterase inhibitor 2-like [Tarenaya hassleriana]
MASDLKTSFLLVPLAVSLLLAASSSSARFHTKLTDPEIKAICFESDNARFRYEFFTAKADLPGLVKLAISSARHIASGTRNQIESLAQKASDPRSKKVYTSCSKNFEDAKTILDDALKALPAGDKDALSVKVSDAKMESDTCKRDLTSVSPDPSSVRKEIEYLEDVSAVALVVIRACLDLCIG